MFCRLVQRATLAVRVALDHVSIMTMVPPVSTPVAWRRRAQCVQLSDTFFIIVAPQPGEHHEGVSQLSSNC